MKKYVINACIFLSIAAAVLLATLEITGTTEYFRITLYDIREGEKTELSGTGTEENPYLIRTTSEFKVFADKVNSGESNFRGEHFVLENDIRLRGECATVPVGSDEEHFFWGTFNGQGHTISGLNMTGDSTGLFGYLKGTVKNLAVKGKIEGEGVGAVCAISDGARIINCYSDVKIGGSTDNGIIGSGECEIYGNCILAGETADAVQLIRDLGQYGPEEDWCGWQADGKSARLTTENVPVINSLEMKISEAGKELPLKAFFSEVDGKWHFCLPPGASYLDDAGMAGLGIGKEEYELLLKPGDTEIEIGGVGYSLAWDDAAVGFPVIMAVTDAENGVDFLEDNKDNVLAGNLYIIAGGSLTKLNLQEISGRGNDSFEADKKGFSIGFQDRTNVLGLGDAYGFNLLPGYRDNSMLSYIVQRDLNKEMGLDYYQTYKLVNFYLDGEYMGMYMLTEKMEIDRNRFALRDLALETEKINGGDLSGFEMKTEGGNETFPDKVWYDIPLEPEDNTGGYLFELNSQDYETDESRFVTDRGVTFTMKGMHYTSKGQVDYCRSLWQDFEDAVYSDSGYNGKGKHFTDYIDLESFADQWIIYEMACESSMEGSIYYYKDSDALGDGRLHAVWEWDCEHAFTSYDNMDKESWILENEKNGAKLEEFSCMFWREIYKHDEFREALTKEWKAKFLPAITKLLAEDDSSGAEESMSGDGSSLKADGVSPLSTYVRAYMPLSETDNLRWNNGTIEKKAERIGKFLEKRLPFLNSFFK